jgi:hypothetical protein
MRFTRSSHWSVITVSLPPSTIPQLVYPSTPFPIALAAIATPIELRRFHDGADAWLACFNNGQASRRTPLEEELI